jgi:hypothetical protein
LLVGAAITFGLWIHAAGQIQQAAAVGARELSQTPLSPELDFESALASEEVVLRRVYDDRWLVIDLQALEQDLPDGNFFIDVVPQMPLLNQQLAMLYIVDEVPGQVPGETRRLLRYPGALLTRNNGPSPQSVTLPSYVAEQYVVQIPLVVGRKTGHMGGGGSERIRWLNVVEEIDTEDSPSDNEGVSPDPFSLANDGPQVDSSRPRGVVALRVYYPAQSAWLSSYADRGRFIPNAGDPNIANDSDVEVLNPGAQRGSPLDRPLEFTNANDEQVYDGTYGGTYGLGIHGAMTSPDLTGDAIGIRPYRRVLVSQAIFRREAFAVDVPNDP